MKKKNWSDSAEALYDHLYTIRGFCFSWDEDRNRQLVGFYRTESYEIEAIFRGGNLTLKNHATGKVLYSGPAHSIEEYENIVELYIPKIKEYKIVFPKNYFGKSEEDVALQLIDSFKKMNSKDIIRLIKEV